MQRQFLNHSKRSLLQIYQVDIFKADACWGLVRVRKQSPSDVAVGTRCMRDMQDVAKDDSLQGLLPTG